MKANKMTHKQRREADQERQAQDRQHFLQTYQERVISMLAEASNYSEIAMWVQVAKPNSPAEVELVQEIEEGMRESVSVIPAPAPEDEFKLDMMQVELNVAHERAVARQQAADLRKRRKQVLEQEFTQEEIDLMEKY